jgi:DinB superfamily
MDYTTLSLADVRAGLDAVAREVQATFGALDSRQLNWRPTAAQWSVAQCFDHLLKMNRLMIQAAEAALAEKSPQTIWQRLPVLPSVLGRLMVRSMSPDATRKFASPAPGQPAVSEIGGDVVQRFVEQLRDAVTRLNTLAEPDAARIIMVSPFITVVAYSVLDAWRLILAHGRRHVEQARRVTMVPGFPR